MDAQPPQPQPPLPPAPFDPGWLYLLAGIALLAATVLIPAFDELAEVRWQRDRALALERHRLERLQRHTDYLEALDRQEPSLVLALAASQLNQIPEGRTLILEPPDNASASASVFAGLEPPSPPALPERVEVDSALKRLATDNQTRPWLLAAGGVCLLVGLLPRARP